MDAIQKDPSLLLRSFPPHKGEGETVATVIRCIRQIGGAQDKALLPSPLVGREGAKRQGGVLL